MTSPAASCWSSMTTLARRSMSPRSAPRRNVIARVKGGESRARFLRPAYYHLSDCFETDEACSFYDTNSGRRLSVGRRIREQRQIELANAESPHRPGAPRNSPEHRLDCAAGGSHQAATAPGRPARLLAGGSLPQARRAGLLAAGGPGDAMQVGMSSSPGAPRGVGIEVLFTARTEQS